MPFLNPWLKAALSNNEMKMWAQLEKKKLEQIVKQVMIPVNRESDDSDADKWYNFCYF